jgi:TM2 domain-containing membrane protein YozV
MKQDNQKYCCECGELINVKAEICPKCGVRQMNAPTSNSKDDKWLISILLCFFLGALGAHRFYTGHIGIGVIQLLTLGGCGIWVLIDFIILLTGNFKDAEGNPITNG